MKNLWALLGLLVALIVGYFVRGRQAITEGFKKNDELKAASAEKEKEIAVLKNDIDKMTPPEKKDMTPEEIEKYWNKK